MLLNLFLHKFKYVKLKLSDLEIKEYIRNLLKIENSLSRKFKNKFMTVLKSKSKVEFDRKCDYYLRKIL